MPIINTDAKRLHNEAYEWRKVNTEYVITKCKTIHINHIHTHTKKKTDQSLKLYTLNKKRKWTLIQL